MSISCKSETDTQNGIRVPRMYAVILHNDDYTTMDFVVDILVRVFHKTQPEAARLMLLVHEEGSAIAGIYTYDVAVTKKSQTDLLAHEKGYPLRLSVCEAEA